MEAAAIPRSKATVPEVYADRLWKLVHEKPVEASVMITDETGGAGFGDLKTNKLVEQAAVRKVKGLVKRKGYSIVSKERDKKGYDLEAKKGRSVLHIEVKGVSGTKLCFPTTKQEVERAGKDPAFRLMVVTEARTKRAKLHDFKGVKLKQLFQLTPLSFMALKQ